MAAYEDLAKKVKRDPEEDDEEEMPSADKVEQSALDDMTEALGLEGEDAKKFSEGIKDYIAACVKRETAEEEKGEEE